MILPSSMTVHPLPTPKSPNYLVWITLVLHSPIYCYVLLVLPNRVCTAFVLCTPATNMIDLSWEKRHPCSFLLTPLPCRLISILLTSLPHTSTLLLLVYPFLYFFSRYQFSSLVYSPIHCLWLLIPFLRIRIFLDVLYWFLMLLA